MRRKLLKMLAGWAPGNGFRISLLRACGYRIGADVYIGPGLVVADELADDGRDLVIGDRVSVGPRVTLVTASSPNRSKLRDIIGYTRGPIIIGNDVWIGAGAIVLPRVTVGEMSIVAAGAVVVEDVPSRSVAAGVPARVVKRIEAGDDR